MRAMVLLAMLPPAIFATNIGVHYPPKPAPAEYVNEYVAVAVTTEGVRRVPMDTRTFNARWTSVNAMPPMVLAASEPMAAPMPQARPQLRERKPHPRNITRKPHDICTRHRLRKVWVSAKRWRCR